MATCLVYIRVTLLWRRVCYTYVSRCYSRGSCFVTVVDTEGEVVEEEEGLEEARGTVASGGMLAVVAETGEGVEPGMSIYLLHQD